jgi:hypothetical protein
MLCCVLTQSQIYEGIALTKAYQIAPFGAANVFAFVSDLLSSLSPGTSFPESILEGFPSLFLFPVSAHALLL